MTPFNTEPNVERPRRIFQIVGRTIKGTIYDMYSTKVGIVTVYEIFVPNNYFFYVVAFSDGVIEVPWGSSRDLCVALKEAEEKWNKINPGIYNPFTAILQEYGMDRDKCTDEYERRYNPTDFER